MRPLTLLITLLLALTLAGCGGDDPKPKFADPTAPPSVTTPVTTPTTPVGTASDRGQKAKGESPRAFIRRFWSVANRAQRTLDSGSLRKLSSLGCDACSRAIAFVDKAAADHAHIRGGSARVSDIAAQTVLVKGKRLTSVRFVITNTRQVVASPTSPKNVVYPAASITDRFVLQRRPDGWRVLTWQVLG